MLYPILPLLFQLFSTVARSDGDQNDNARTPKITPFTPTPGSKLLGGVFGKKTKGKVASIIRSRACCCK